MSNSPAAPTCARARHNQLSTARRSSLSARRPDGRSHSKPRRPTLESQLELLVRELGPALRTEPGVGVISAAQLLGAWSHRGRFRSEAAYASLAGAAPIPASSGQIVRHRLNRGGDRQPNRALHTIVLSRLANHRNQTLRLRPAPFPHPRDRSNHAVEPAEVAARPPDKADVRVESDISSR